MTTFHTVYFIGIKGVGMSALALVAKGMGFAISGSDVAEEFITDEALHSAGITLFEGFAAEHISPDIDLVVIGTAFGDDNPEVQQAKKLGLTCYTYSEFQAYVMEGKKTLAVAGTHGKTTTTSLLTYLLYKASAAPSWIIGTGHVSGLPAHGGAGLGEWFVTEADDYKKAANDPTPKFLDLTPFGAIITSIEHDHPDLYPTLDDCIAAFCRFIERVREDGFLVINGDDANIQSLVAEFPQKRWITYGEGDALDFTVVPQAKGFTLSHQGQSLGPFTLALPGRHNMMNATAAIIVALDCGLDLEAIQTILPTFETVERRFQIIGTVGEQVVIDDYAHHPTAVRLTLEATRQRFPNQPIWCLFQSHTFSRTKALLTEFGTAFQLADQVIVTDIFGSAREAAGTISPEEVVAEIQRHQSHVNYVSLKDLPHYLADHAPANAVIITMGAGDIYKVGREYLSTKLSDH